MPSRSKQKGNRVERELVNQAKTYGLEAKRAYASNGLSLGHSEEVDLLIGKYRIQSKARKSFPKWLTEASQNVDAVVFREDNKKPTIMIDFELFLQFVALQESKDVFDERQSLPFIKEDKRDG